MYSRQREKYSRTCNSNKQLIIDIVRVKSLGILGAAPTNKLGWQSWESTRGSNDYRN